MNYGQSHLFVEQKPKQYTGKVHLFGKIEIHTELQRETMIVMICKIHGRFKSICPIVSGAADRTFVAAWPYKAQFDRLR